MAPKAGKTKPHKSKGEKKKKEEKGSHITTNTILSNFSIFILVTPRRMTSQFLLSLALLYFI